MLTRRLPPLNALRAFEVAGRLLTFRAAAEELGVSQGAVAQQVRGLEDHLGLALFQRHARGLSLTPQGAAYLAEVAAAFQTLTRATEALSPPAERVTMSVTPTVATRLVIPRLGALQARLPGVELRTIASEELPDFSQGAVDIAVGLARPVPEGVEARPFIPHEVIAVGAPSLSGPLEEMPLVHHCFDYWAAFLGRPGPLPGPRYALTSMAIEAALAGHGAILCARVFVAEDLGRGRLRQLSPRVLRVGPDYMCWRRRGAQSPEAQAAWEWLAALVA